MDQHSSGVGYCSLVIPNYTVILTHFVHVLLSFYLYFQCYVGVLSLFQVFDHIGAKCEETKRFRRKTKKKREITLKATYITFAMEKSIRRMTCPTHQRPLDQFFHALGMWRSPSFVRARRLENGLVWSPTHLMRSYILSHECRNLSLDILDLGTL